jgi:hypothetical protein
VRHVRFIRWGLVALLVATLALTVGGLRLARPAQGGVDRPTYSRAAAPAPAVHQNAVPFTRVDVFLLVAGGTMLLLLGSAAVRVRDERPAVVKADGDA